MPAQWTTDLIAAISDKSTVHESTLRRSSGYAFAFLSILRSEPRNLPTTLTPAVIKFVVKLSLPCDAEMEQHRTRLKLDSFVFRFGNTYVSEGDYDWKCRVHALNVLRLMIMDSPLAAETQPFIGDAIISALLAFGDGSWAVANSGNMVFAATMLRSIDSNKNGKELNKGLKLGGGTTEGGGVVEEEVVSADTFTGKGSGKGGAGGNKERSVANAITAKELFTLYPPLKVFLLNTLKEGLCGGEGSGGMNLSPTTYPILLLLSRLSPPMSSASDSKAAAFYESPTKEFVGVVLGCLDHSFHKVRLLASRALGVISDDDEKTALCLYIGDHVLNAGFNSRHGGLLAIESLVASGLVDLKKIETMLRQATSYCCTSSMVVRNDGDVGSTAAAAATVPPAIFTITLACLEAAWRSSGGEETVWAEEIRALGHFVLSVGESSSTDASREDDGRIMIGLANACATAAATLCKIDIRGGGEKFADIRRVVLDLKAFDGRTAGIKAIKKVVMNEPEYGKIRDGASATALELAGILKAGLEAELAKGPGCGGAHAPSLRRMSRCVIELCYENPSIVGAVLGGEDGGEKDWELALRLRAFGLRGATGGGEFEGDFADGADGDEMIALNGNAIELMGLVLCAMGLDAEEKEKEKRLKRFYEAIKGSISPWGSWRVRHSVARAIGESGTLSWNASPVVVMLWRVMLQLLQDSDPDVRKCAGPRPSSRFKAVTDQLS